MNNVLLTGSNRGIGLGIVKAILNNKQSKVKNIIATCRKPEEAKELKEISNAHSNVHVLKLEVTDFPSYKSLIDEVSKIVGDDGLNTLINNAGVAGKFLKIGFLKPEAMAESFLINTIAPTILTKECIPLLKMGVKSSDNPVGSIVVNISSVLGSIAMNDTGGYYPYRCSKSGLNASTKSLSVDLKPYKITTVVLHPGWVKTEMGGPKAPMEVDDATNQIVNTIINLKQEQTGSFLNFDGKPLDW